MQRLTLCAAAGAVVLAACGGDPTGIFAIDAASGQLTLASPTALNTALEVAQTGILERLGIEMIGATPEVINKAESNGVAGSRTMSLSTASVPLGFRVILVWRLS